MLCQKQITCTCHLFCSSRRIHVIIATAIRGKTTQSTGFWPKNPVSQRRTSRHHQFAYPQRTRYLSFHSMTTQMSTFFLCPFCLKPVRPATGGMSIETWSVHDVVLHTWHSMLFPRGFGRNLHAELQSKSKDCSMVTNPKVLRSISLLCDVYILWTVDRVYVIKLHHQQFRRSRWRKTSWGVVGKSIQLIWSSMNMLFHNGICAKDSKVWTTQKALYKYLKGVPLRISPGGSSIQDSLSANSRKLAAKM